jgi:hypothetical protein
MSETLTVIVAEKYRPVLGAVGWSHLQYKSKMKENKYVS